MPPVIPTVRIDQRPAGRPSASVPARDDGEDGRPPFPPFQAVRPMCFTIRSRAKRSQAGVRRDHRPARLAHSRDCLRRGLQPRAVAGGDLAAGRRADARGGRHRRHGRRVRLGAVAARSRAPGTTVGCAGSWICCTTTGSPWIWRPPRRHRRPGWCARTRRSARSTHAAPGWRSAAGRPGAPVRRSSVSIRWTWSGNWPPGSAIIPPSSCGMSPTNSATTTAAASARSASSTSGRWLRDAVRRRRDAQSRMGDGLLEPALLVLRRDRRAGSDHRFR